MATFGEVLNNITIAAGRLLRRNAADSAFEGVPFSRAFSLNNDATTTLPEVTGAGAGTLGFFFVLCLEDSSAALFMLSRGNAVAYEVSDPMNEFSATQGTASSVNIYNQGSAPYTYFIENKRGGARTFQVYLLVDV